MKDSGFTLIEIIVTIAIIFILLSLGIKTYNSWKKRRDIENDINKIYSLIQEYRAKAFLEKKIFICNFSNDRKRFQVFYNSNLIESIILKNEFKFNGSSSQIVIDSHGTLSGPSIVPVKNIISGYNCLTIDDINIRLGLFNGNKCVAK